MGKRNTVVKRIDPELNEIIEEIQKKNELTRRQASREAARILRAMKIQRKEVEF